MSDLPCMALLEVYRTLENNLDDLDAAKRAIKSEPMFDKEEKMIRLEVCKSIKKEFKSTRKKLRTIGILEGWIDPLN